MLSMAFQEVVCPRRNSAALLAADPTLLLFTREPTLVLFPSVPNTPARLLFPLVFGVLFTFFPALLVNAINDVLRSVGGLVSGGTHC